MNVTTIKHINEARNKIPLNGNRGAIHRGVVTSEPSGGLFLIDSAIEAARAFSCVVKPEKGDLVAYCQTPAKSYILGILEREGNQRAEIQIEGADELTIKSRKMNLAASERLDIKSLKSIDITAYLGALSLTGTNLVTTIKESIIQSARFHISNMANYSLNVKQVLRFHGKHQIITADEEIRMDGERINMG